MKLNWIAALLLSVATLSVNAQESEEMKIRLGVICSPLVSWGKSDAGPDKADGSRIGINTGLMFDRFFARNYAFATGISIHTMGASVNYSNGVTSFKTNDESLLLPANTVVKYKLQYIDIPFGIKMRTVYIGNAAIFAQLGLNTMFNIKATADINSLKKTDLGVSDHISTFYMGYHAMLGVEYKIVGNTALVGGIQYMNGFTNVTSNIVLHNVELRVGLLF